MENSACAYQSRVQVLLAAEVAEKKVHMWVMKALADVKHIDAVASGQQLLHQVLAQEA